MTYNDVKFDNLDIILFAGCPKKFGLNRLFDNFIKYFTNSEFTHIGFVLNNPHWIHKDLKGLYLWNSGIYKGGNVEENNKETMGVQLNALHEYINDFEGHVYIRKINTKDLDIDKLVNIHKKVHDVPYNTNIVDWVCAYFNVDRVPYKQERFWCSAFVAYVLENLGYLNKSLNWDVIKPCFYNNMEFGGFDDSLIEIKYDKLIQIK